MMKTDRSLLALLVLLPALIQAETDFNVVVATEEGIWTSLDRTMHAMPISTGRMQVNGMMTAAMAVNRKDGIIYYSVHGNGENVIVGQEYDKTTLHLRQGNFKKYTINSFVRGLAYDEGSGTLYWTNMMNSTICSCKIDEGPCTEEEPLNLKEGEHPAAIAVHNGYLYWTNNNHISPSINRNRLGTTKSSKIVRPSAGLFRPNGIAIRTSRTERIYWTDDSLGDEFVIKSSELNGGDQRTEVRGHHQNPMDLVYSSPFDDTTNGTLYWTDWADFAVWTTALDATDRRPSQMTNWKNRRIWPMGLVVLYPV